MIVKHCAACGEDYMPHVEFCADCGETLVTRDEDAPLGDAASPAGPPPGEYRRLLAAERVAEIDPLVARLAAAGVPARVNVGPRGNTFELAVRDEERARAIELLSDALGDSLTANATAERHFDAERGRYSVCPACETTLPSGAAECPECGLLLEGEAPTCERCGAEVADEAGKCGACGHASEG
jgi:ribosomal protein L40E